MENFYPSNGTEGAMFMDEYCDNCYKRHQCTILKNSLVGKEPKQWVYKDGYPTCTSYCKHKPSIRKRKVNDNSLKLF